MNQLPLRSPNRNLPQRGKRLSSRLSKRRHWTLRLGMTHNLRWRQRSLHRRRSRSLF